MQHLRFALIKITLCLIIGVVAAYFSSLPLWIWASAAVLVLCVNALLYLKLPPQRWIIPALTLCLQGFLAGGFTACYYQQIAADHYIRKTDFESSAIRVSLTERLRPGRKGQRFLAKVAQLNQRRCSGEILIHLPDSVFYPIGTVLDLKGTLVPHPAKANPGQFDYGEYLVGKKIFAQFYPKSVAVTGFDPSYLSRADALRTDWLQTIASAGLSREALPVFAALLLGQQTDIGKEMLKDYQLAGAVHILSVSGLHVGFIVMFLTALLKPLPNHRWGRALRLLIILVSLWSFAILAGLSPSVVRSATMFSFLAWGAQLRRPANAFHTLAVSAMVLLLIHPAYLFDVGFQLSYAAVAFILWLQPILNNLWQPKTKIAGYARDICTVSVAAQIGTLPLSLYYFHQFPGLFMITNLLIIPLVGVIMGAGLLLLMLSAINWIPGWIVWVNEMLIKLLNFIISKVASVDALAFQNLPFHLMMVPLAYLLTLLLVGAASKPTFPRITALLAMLISLQGGWLISKSFTARQSELIVFQGKEPAAAIRQGTQIEWMTNGEVSADAFATQFYGASVHKKALPNTISYGRERIFRTDSTGVLPNKKPDILWISGNPKLNPERVVAILNPKKIVVDGSNTRWTTYLWKRICHQKNIPFHSTYEKGFYKL